MAALPITWGDVLEGTGHILHRVEVSLHPVIAPKVGLLPLW